MEKYVYNMYYESGAPWGSEVFISWVGAMEGGGIKVRILYDFGFISHPH